MNPPTICTVAQSPSRQGPVYRASKILRHHALSFMAFLLLLGVSTAAVAMDWSSCQDDLDRLRRAAGDAADVAETVNSEAEELEAAKDSLNSCRLWQRDCWLERSQYDSALSDFESAKADLESELDTVSSAVRSVESSCEYDMGAGRTPSSRVGQADRMCALLGRFKGRLPNQTLMDTCKKSKTEEECRRCLE